MTFKVLKYLEKSWNYAIDLMNITAIKSQSRNNFARIKQVPRIPNV